MNSVNYEKTVKKTEDVYSLFLVLRDKIKVLNVHENSKKLMMNFITRVLMEQLLVLKGVEKETYINKLQDLDLDKYFIQKSLKGRIKKWWARLHFHSYCNHFFGGVNE